MKEREPERGGVRPRPGPTRCPFCHDECAVAEACVCAECLSRHHGRCWDEGRGCSSCRGTRRLEAAKRVRPWLVEPAQLEYGKAIDEWIRLGIIYNVVLVLETVVVLNARLIFPPVLFAVALGALFANVCFLVGPGLDLVAHRLGHRGRKLRAITFALGLVLAMVLAYLCGHDLAAMPPHAFF